MEAQRARVTGPEVDADAGVHDSTGADQPAAGAFPDRLAALEADTGKLSFRNTTALIAVRRSLNALRKRLGDGDEGLLQRARSLQQLLGEKLERNKAHQQQLEEHTLALLEVLQRALDEGRSQDALPAWDRIQGNISNISGPLHDKLQSRAARYKSQLNELRDWKIFAATEKKKVLIQQMRHLLESRMSPFDKSRYISDAHKQWKQLGRSEQNERLWREFKKLSDQAWQPCKESFRQRKQLMVENLKMRSRICEGLERDLQAVDPNNVNVALLNKLINANEQEWKRYAPVEQSRIKPLQRRFYKALNELRRLRREAFRDNAGRKQQLIARATELAELEDSRQAMNEARQLQRQWKELGPGPYKEDRKHWEDFRAACDRIFTKGDQEAAALRENARQTSAEASKVLEAMEALLELANERFIDARADYQMLTQRFANTGLKEQRNKLVERFNRLRHRIEARFKSLPGRKWLALREAVVSRAAYLEKLEQELLGCTDGAQLDSVRLQHDGDAWERLGDCNNAEYDELLQARLRQALQAGSMEALLELARDGEQRLRSLCVSLEIRANLETPAQDQALRMEIQLEELRQGFGQHRPARGDNASLALDAELRSHCIGPLDHARRQELLERLQVAVQRLT